MQSLILRYNGPHGVLRPYRHPMNIKRKKLKLMRRNKAVLYLLLESRPLDRVVSTVEAGSSKL